MCLNWSAMYCFCIVFLVLFLLCKTLHCTELKEEKKTRSWKTLMNWMSPFLVAFYFECVSRVFYIKIFFSLAVPLLYRCNFVRQCVCQHEMWLIQLSFEHTLWLCMYMNYLYKGYSFLTFWTNNEFKQWCSEGTAHAPDTPRWVFLYK